MTGPQANTIGRNTGITLGLMITVIGLVVAVMTIWTSLATESRVAASERIENRRRINAIEPKLEYVTGAMIRLEAKFETRSPVELRNIQRMIDGD